MSLDPSFHGSRFRVLNLSAYGPEGYGVGLGDTSGLLGLWDYGGHVSYKLHEQDWLLAAFIRYPSGPCTQIGYTLAPKHLYRFQVKVKLYIVHVPLGVIAYRHLYAACSAASPVTSGIICQGTALYS